MKKLNAKSKAKKGDDIPSGYTAAQMKNAVRGKHVKPYRSTYSVKIHKDDGSGVVEKLDFQKNPDMLPEYDLKKMKGGVRGKYYDRNRSGHSAKISNEDGTVVYKYFTVKEGAVMLAPDVRKYFSDSIAVNNALRCLIPLVAQKKKLKSAA